jgi:signal transduction histidine kinase
MTFRTKLTLYFSLLIGAVISILGLIIYFFAERYTQQEFRDRLRNRAFIAAQLYLEQDELSARAIARIQQQFVQSLPDEEVHIYDNQRKPSFELNPMTLPSTDHIFDKIEKERQIAFKDNKRQWVGVRYDDNQGEFYVIVSAIDRYGQSKLDNLQRVLVISFVSSIGFVLLLGWFYAGQVLRPIGDIVQEANNINASNLHLRVREHNSRDEIAALAHTFNQMLDRLQLSFEMQKNFISNASHELRNPITAISGEIEVALLKERTAAEYIASLETLQNETDRLQKLTSDLLGLAQANFDEAEKYREEMRVDELLLECQRELQQTHPEFKIKLHLEEMPEGAEKLIVKGNSSLMKIALNNVIENACKFSDKQVVTVWLHSKGKAFSVVVQDRGIGIPEEDQAYVFQTFYRARNARGHKGTGIGLSLTEKIIRMHGGRIEVNSVVGNGTSFTIYLRD